MSKETTEQPSTSEILTSDLLTIKSPEGDLIHTHVGVTEQDCIHSFLETEKTMWWILNLGRKSRGQEPKPVPGWDHYLVEGYTLVPVKLTEVNDKLNNGD
ncbi:hypothetical protein N8Z76_00490 [Gammaproteobacteria bacterium]|nr:hypothetical protein [Gammaproteobacteria bacterium]